MTTPNDPESRRAWRTDDEWDRLRARMEAAAVDPLPSTGSSRARPYAFAAAAALLIAVSGVAWMRHRDAVGVWQVIATQPGERRTLLLPDSSTATIGPASTLRFRFAGRRRDVALQGLAAFTVRHDARRPFSVVARNAIATDIGTEFSVRAYDGDTAVIVAVSTGEVALSSAKVATRLALHAGDAGSVDAAGITHSLGTTAIASTAWVSGALVFTDAPLTDVAAELTRWFGVSVRVDNPALSRRRVTAQYVHPSLDDVLSALGATLHARVERRAGAYVFTGGAR